MSNDKIDQLKEFASKDLEQTKTDLHQVKDKVSELGNDIKQKGQETVEDVKNFAAKDLDQTKADLQQAKNKAKICHSISRITNSSRFMDCRKTIFR